MIHKRYTKDALTFYMGNLDFEELEKNYSDRVNKVKWIPILAYCAFFCFITGGIIGYLNYQEFIKKENKLTISNTVQKSDQKNHIPVMPKLPP